MDILEKCSFGLILLYAYFEGITHAILYSGRMALSFKWNEHIIYNIQRILLVLAIFCKPDYITIISSILCYSFIHNGSYYTARNKIDGSYPEKWFDDSNSSTARIELNIKLRTSLFILGILLFIGNIFLW